MFNIGDVVRLKSGSPAMVVREVLDTGEIHIYWFCTQRQQIQQTNYPLPWEVLERVPVIFSTTLPTTPQTAAGDPSRAFLESIQGVDYPMTPNKDHNNGYKEG